MVGTGADGELPIAPDVHVESKRRGAGIAALATAEAWRPLDDLNSDDEYAVLRVTC